MRLAHLSLTGFQAHTQFDLDLSPTITTITGPSDRGKSSLLRALRWCVLNDFAGADFVRDGCKEARVEVTVEHGKKKLVVSRTRRTSGTVNSYQLGDQEYKAFGTGVPKDIEEALRLNPVNFQDQHDAPFWFTESAPEVSRRLNAIIDLSVIDTSLSNVTGEVRKAMDRRGVCQERLQDVQGLLERLAPQRKRVVEFGWLRNLNQEWERVVAKQDLLRSILGRVRGLRVRECRQQAEDGTELLALAREAVKLGRRHIRLSQTLTDLQVVRSLTTPPPAMTRVTEARAALGDLDSKHDLLQAMLTSLTKHSTLRRDALQRLQQAEDRFHQATKDAVCPLCHHPLQPK